MQRLSKLSSQVKPWVEERGNISCRSYHLGIGGKFNETGYI